MKPPVEAPTSRQASPAGSSPKRSSAAARLRPARETNGSPLFWALRALARFLAFVVFRFRVRTSGQEHIPAGGYLVVAAVHRGWMDPFLIMHALPPEPRVWFLGSGPTAFDARTGCRSASGSWPGVPPGLAG